MTTRLANPSWTPELFAKTTVIDFTVTQLGLEQQLLGIVINKEQRSLEETMKDLVEEIARNTKELQQCNDDLLKTLSEAQGSLVDDPLLMTILTKTKSKAEEVKNNLKTADEKKIEINEKREQYRVVATRGSVL